MTGKLTEVKVVVEKRPRTFPEPTTTADVFNQMDENLACDQAELEEAITVLKNRVTDIVDRRNLLGAAAVRVKRVIEAEE